MYNFFYFSLSHDRFFELHYKFWADHNDDIAKSHSIQINDTSLEMKYQLTGLVANLSYSFKVSEGLFKYGTVNRRKNEYHRG